MVLGGVGVVAVACGASDESELPLTPTATGGAGGATTGTFATTGNGGFGFGGTGPTASGCSADLQSTVDDNGAPVEQCPPDQGCNEGMCVPACEAAAASKGSIGCEYWVPYPPFYVNHNTPTSYDGACHAVFVANTWGRSAQVAVTYQGQTLDVASFGRIPSGVAGNTQYNPIPADGIPPGEVAVLFLSHRPGTQHGTGSSLECPVTPAVLEDTAVHNSGRGDAFEIISDTPLTSYDIMPYGGAPSYLPSASLLFPRTAFGDNYVAVGPHDSANGGQHWMMLVGTQDGTTVDVAPLANLPAGGGVPSAPQGSVTQITIDDGEIVQWMNGDPSGAVVQASAPVGVWTGNTYLRVATPTSPSGGGQDSAHQQLPPISALGAEYVGAHIPSRLASGGPETILYRIMGVVEGTTLSWEGMPSGAPTSLAAGQVAEFEASATFVVRAQDDDHPFVLTQYMPGRPADSADGCGPPNQNNCQLGDEEWVVVLPPRQFLQRYAFFADPTYGVTNLAITRVRGAEGFEDVEIACLGNVTGWEPVGTSGEYEVAHVDLYRGGVGVTPACATSNHLATSSGAFGITVWGTDYFASYGYPAGGNVGAINDVVVVPTPR